MVSFEGVGQHAIQRGLYSMKVRAHAVLRVRGQWSVPPFNESCTHPSCYVCHDAHAMATCLVISDADAALLRLLGIF